MRLSHSPARTQASFDDRNLVSHAGLVPLLALAERCGLAVLVRQHVRVAGLAGVNADLKAGCLVAGADRGMLPASAHGRCRTSWPQGQVSFPIVRAPELAARKCWRNPVTSGPVLGGRDWFDSRQRSQPGGVELGKERRPPLVLGP
jgi:hypothetical protein